MSPIEIKDLRKLKKLTQEQLGEICGVRNSSVSRWEKGVDSPSGPALKILKQLQNGDLTISQISELELKLLNQNVTVGNFRNREDYLTASLKHLLVHGSFLDILPERDTGPALRMVAEDPAKPGENIDPPRKQKKVNYSTFKETKAQKLKRELIQEPPSDTEEQA